MYHNNYFFIKNNAAEIDWATLHYTRYSVLFPYFIKFNFLFE